MKAMLSVISGLAVLAGGLTLAPVSAEAQARNRLPQGSYARTCQNAQMNQGRLTAQCRSTRGEMRGSTLELSRCGNSDISNRDGILTCGSISGTPDRFDGRPGQNRPGPNRPGQGYGRHEITVYRDSNYRGASQTFNREISNLRDYGLNDAVSSIRLPRNSGSWQVCTDANFRGRCETISSDVSDLVRLRLNDTISSLRPIDNRGPGRR